MAVTNNVLFLGLSGTIGGELTIKKYKDKIVVCKKIGARTKESSEAQKNNEMIFKAANRLAKEVYRDPVKREEARLRLNVAHGNELYRAILKELREAFISGS
jgi:hypothetical protein